MAKNKILLREKDSSKILKLLTAFPVVAILGSRQCGKTTLANEIHHKHHFDLENPRDLAKLDNPQLTLEDLTGLIIIDEIQRKPDLFTLIRYLVDRNPKQKYLILGSASRDLIKQSSESLAGRIAYYHLGGFRITDIESNKLKSLWIRGSFPRSFLAKNEEQSLLWRENYIQTFLERDIPQLGIQIPANTLRRFWIMLSHYHGQILNYSELGKSFGISDTTTKKYIDILQGTFMVRLLMPWYSNVGKRLVKSPKLYLQDSGIFHALQGINNHSQLIAHPKLGASWEGFALEKTTQHLGLSAEKLFYWATHSGAEVDLFWQDKGKNFAIEFKYADAPIVTRSMHSVIKDLKLSHLWIIYPGKEKYALTDKIKALPLSDIDKEFSIV